MLFRHFSFPRFRAPETLNARTRLALARTLRAALAKHSPQHVRGLYDSHDPQAFALALGLLSVRLQLDALSMLPLSARLQLWSKLSASVRRALWPLVQPGAYAVASSVGKAA